MSRDMHLPSGHFTFAICHLYFTCQSRESHAIFSLLHKHCYVTLYSHLTLILRDISLIMSLDTLQMQPLSIIGLMMPMLGPVRLILVICDELTTFVLLRHWHCFFLQMTHIWIPGHLYWHIDDINWLLFGPDTALILFYMFHSKYCFSCIFTRLS